MFSIISSTSLTFVKQLNMYLLKKIREIIYNVPSDKPKVCKFLIKIRTLSISLAPIALPIKQEPLCYKAYVDV